MNREQRRKAGYVKAKEPLSIKFGVSGEQILIEFNDAVRWISMDLEHSLEFLAKVQKHVDQLKLNALSAERSHTNGKEN